jgi:hypothetical protein
MQLGYNAHITKLHMTLAPADAGLKPDDVSSCNILCPPKFS